MASSTSSARPKFPGDAWTDYLPESAVLEADWKELDCGMYNTETKTCVQLKSNY
jgi:urea transport system substrate-binding protein